MPGVVSLPRGFGHAEHGNEQALAARVDGASYNDLGDPLALDGPSGNAALNGIEVVVQAVEAEVPDQQ